MQTAGMVSPGGAQRRDDRQYRSEPERRRSQAGAGIVPPSPALVRHGSKQRKGLNALGPGTPGQVTPSASAVAQVNVPVNAPPHAYPSGAAGNYEYTADDSFHQQQYGRTSPMVSTAGAAPPAVSQVRATGDVGPSNGDDLQGGNAAQPSSFWKIMTCHCG